MQATTRLTSKLCHYRIATTFSLNHLLVSAYVYYGMHKLSEVIPLFQLFGALMPTHSLRGVGKPTIMITI